MADYTVNCNVYDTNGTYFLLYGGKIIYGQTTDLNNKKWTNSLTISQNSTTSKTRPTNKYTLTYTNYDTTERYVCAYYQNNQNQKSDIVTWYTWQVDKVWIRIRNYIRNSTTSLDIYINNSIPNYDYMNLIENVEVSYLDTYNTKQFNIGIRPLSSSFNGLSEYLYIDFFTSKAATPTISEQWGNPFTTANGTIYDNSGISLCPIHSSFDGPSTILEYTSNSGTPYTMGTNQSDNYKYFDMVNNVFLYSAPTTYTTKYISSGNKFEFKIYLYI